MNLPTAAELRGIPIKLNRIVRMDADRTLDPNLYCPPTRFVVRSCCKEDKLKEFIQNSINWKQIVLISGPLGSGKSSFLNWAKDKIQNIPNHFVVEEHFFNDVVLPNSQYDNPFSTYDNLLRKLKKQKQSKFIDKSIDFINKSKRYIKSIGVPGIVSVDPNPIKEAPIPPIRQLTSDLVQVFKDLTRDDNFLVIILDDVQNASDMDFNLLLNLFRDSPNRVIFIAAYETEPEAQEKETFNKYNKLNDLFTDEIILDDMNIDEIISLLDASTNCETWSQPLKTFRKK